MAALPRTLLFRTDFFVARFFVEGSGRAATRSIARNRRVDAANLERDATVPGNSRLAALVRLWKHQLVVAQILLKGVTAAKLIAHV